MHQVPASKDKLISPIMCLDPNIDATSRLFNFTAVKPHPCAIIPAAASTDHARNQRTIVCACRGCCGSVAKSGTAATAATGSCRPSAVSLHIFNNTTARWKAVSDAWPQLQSRRRKEYAVNVVGSKPQCGSYLDQGQPLWVTGNTRYSVRVFESDDAQGVNAACPAAVRTSGNTLRRLVWPWSPCTRYLTLEDQCINSNSPYRVPTL